MSLLSLVFLLYFTKLSSKNVFLKTAFTEFGRRVTFEEVLLFRLI